MSEFNYFPINTEINRHQIPTEKHLGNKQIDLSLSAAKIFTFATVIVMSFPPIAKEQGINMLSNNIHYSSNQPVNLVPISKDKNNNDKTTKTIDVNKLIEDNKELEEEMKIMQKEINKPVIEFEDFVVKIGLFLSALFLLLSLPIFIGYPSLVGTVMSLGLPVFVKIRRWERGE